MKDLRGIRESDKMHYLQCPDCAVWFDMRDLAAVFAHQHWMDQKPEASFSHVQRVGKDNEYYVRVKGRLLTLRRRESGNSYPHQRA